MIKKTKTYYWFVIGVRAYHMMKESRFASAAKLIRWGLEEGVFEPDESDGSSWRTSILLHYCLLYTSDAADE